MLGKQGRCANCGRTFNFNKASRWSAFVHAIGCCIAHPFGVGITKEGTHDNETQD